MTRELRNRALEQHALACLYLNAKDAVIAHGFASEVDWQEEVTFDRIEEADFLREAAWVVLASGFRESIVRRRFSAISEAFLNWQSAKAIIRHRKRCRADALRAFGHIRKIDAIVRIVDGIATDGFPAVKQQVAMRGIEYLCTFPFFGPVTSCHFLKNVGVPVIKPDRHLVRLASLAG